MTKKIEGMAEIEEDENGKLKIQFQPGCFDSFEGTQEELDEAIAMITKMFEDGTAQELAQEVDIDELMETDPEMAERIFQAIARAEGEDLDDNTPPRTLQ